MFIACKSLELYPPVISDFVQVTKNSYSKSQLLEMEVSILKVLDFELESTTPVSLLESYSLAVGIHMDEEVLFRACYYIDISMLSHRFLRFSKSLVVICALNLALKWSLASEELTQQPS